MKTSYFSNIRNLKKVLSISQYPPKWYAGPQFKVLAPPWDLVNLAQKGLSDVLYEKEFHRQVLADLDPREVYDAIVAEYGEDVVLLCFEKLESPGDYCHRRIVARWFEKNLGVEVPEWEKPARVRNTMEF